MKWPAASTPARSVLLLTAGIALGMLALTLWNRFAQPKPVITPSERATEVPLARETKSLPTRRVPVQAAVVEDKAKIERALPGALSRRSLLDNSVLVGKPHEIPAGWEHGYLVTPTIDNTTGEMGADVKAKAPPFYEFRKRFELEGRFLFAGNNVFETDLRVLPVRFNAKDGGMSIEPSLFGGLEVRRDDSRLGARAGVGITVTW